MARSGRGGRNGQGRLGDGTTITRTSPVKVQGISGVTAISAGEMHSVAVKSDGTVWTWGDDSYGQLGVSHLQSSSAPLKVIGLDLGAPTGSVWMGGAAYTTRQAVTLSLSATDDDNMVTQMRISNDGVFDAEPLESFKGTKDWTLAPGDGPKTVYVRFRDTSGVESETVSARLWQLPAATATTSVTQGL